MRGAVLSIQSEVVYGHVGNAAARFALKRRGFDVLSLPTVLLSNRPDYPSVRGETVAGDRLAALLDGLERVGALDGVVAVLSGYLGAPDHAEIVHDAVLRVRARTPHAVYCLDPVFGDDDGGAYAKPGVAEAMTRHLLPLADIVTPNRFELASLTSMRIETADDAAAAARRLGRPLVIATSSPDGPDRVATLAVTRDTGFAASVARLEDPPHGSGDLLAALYLANHLDAMAPGDALAQAAGAVDVLLRDAVSRRAQEMRLVALQDALIAPPGPAVSLRRL